jgi:hypothetical protein
MRLEGQADRRGARNVIAGQTAEGSVFTVPLSR